MGNLPGVDLNMQGVINIFQGLACYALSFASTGLVIFTILAGFRYMWAGGNSEKVTAAKKNFGQVLIGAVVIFGTYVIINTISTAVGDGRIYYPFTC